MQRRRLGDGLEVSALGLGCMGMSEFYGPRDDAEALRVLDRAIELGVDFLDTADMYGPHHNEELIGRFLAEHGRDVVLATKFGIVRERNAYARTIDNRPAYARRALEASLGRLGRERIDLYYVHRVDRERPIEEVMGALADLVREGKIGHVGLCEVSAPTLRRAHAVHPVAAVQMEYSLWTRDAERDVLAACRELAIGFVAYAPLGRGFLTGAVGDREALAAGDVRLALPRFAADHMQANRRLVEALDAIARRRGCTKAQLALAWLLAKGPDIVPIPGTKRLGYLEENAAAAEIVLTAAEVTELDAAAAAHPVLGERYTEEGMKGVGA